MQATAIGRRANRRADAGEPSDAAPVPPCRNTGPSAGDKQAHHVDNHKHNHMSHQARRGPGQGPGRQAPQSVLMSAPRACGGAMLCRLARVVAAGRAPIGDQARTAKLSPTSRGPVLR